MKHIFYFITLIPILWELRNVIGPKSVNAFLTTLTKTNSNDLTSKQVTFIFLMFFYMVWNFIGLFTVQWPAFLFLFVLGLSPKRYIWIRWVDSLISVLLLLFIVLNAYHFKIDLWGWILSLGL